MNGRLSFITLTATDVNHTSTSYQRLFDWPEPRKVGPAVFFELPNLTIALMRRDALATFCGTDIEPQSASDQLISWNVPERANVEQLLSRAVTMGATITKPEHELSWGGVAGVLRTFDGHLWEIVWNPTAPPA